jgi:hypothetical protein
MSQGMQPPLYIRHTSRECLTLQLLQASPSGFLAVPIHLGFMMWWRKEGTKDAKNAALLTLSALIAALDGVPIPGAKPALVVVRDAIKTLDVSNQLIPLLPHMLT